jgi:hypothetical protein
MLTTFSRYRFCETAVDEQGRTFLDQRRPYRYRAFSDNTVHLVQQGESIFTIAAKRFGQYPRPAGLWWVIADFQPVPIHDPTIQLAAGARLVIPSARAVADIILNPDRERESRI